MKWKKILNFSKSEYGNFKFEVIEFHDKFGTKATVAAFKVSKSTIYD